MRRVFRLIGGIRFVLGATIVLVAFLLRSQLGELWTGLLILFGAVVGVSGLIAVLLIIAYYIVFPIAFLTAGWLIFEWSGTTFLDSLERNFGLIYFYWTLGLFGTPLAIWQFNRFWFFRVRNFSIDEEPDDTPHPELHAIGAIGVTDSSYLGAVSITEKGLIIDRRNFAPVVLPWRWITSLKPDEISASTQSSAIITMRNDDDEFITLTVPWNEDLLNLNTARLTDNKA